MTLGQYSSVLPLHLVTKRSIFKTADHIAFLWSYNPRLNTQAEFAVVNFISVSGLSNNARDTQYCYPHLAEEITTARLMALILSTTKFETFVSTYNLWFNCYLGLNFLN